MSAQNHETSMGYYSDLFKEIYSFRPRGRTWSVHLGRTPTQRQDAINELHKRLEEKDERVAQERIQRRLRKNREKRVFDVKVAALGLDPAKYYELL